MNELHCSNMCGISSLCVTNNRIKYTFINIIWFCHDVYASSNTPLNELQSYFHNNPITLVPIMLTDDQFQSVEKLLHYVPSFVRRTGTITYGN